jgi:hypothetical protein
MLPEPDEPELLLSPTDTAKSNNPLRDEVIHARYAARMFTPQTRTEMTNGAAASGTNSEPAAFDTQAAGGPVNPLRAGGLRSQGVRSAGSRSAGLPRAEALRQVTPVSYEEPVVAMEPMTVAAPLQPSSPANVPLNMPASQPDAETSVTAEPRPILAEPGREETVTPALPQRKLPAMPDSNRLREEQGESHRISLENPLRSASHGGNTEQVRGHSSGKVQGTGRYATHLAPLGSSVLEANTSPASVSTSASEVAPLAPAGFSSQANPLR